MTKYKHDIVLSSFIEQESQLTDIVLSNDIKSKYFVVNFMDRSVNVVSARWDFELFCFVELSIVTDIGLEYIKLI